MLVPMRVKNAGKIIAENRGNLGLVVMNVIFRENRFTAESAEEKR